MRKKQKDFNISEGLLGHDVTDYPDLAVISKKFKGFNLLWTTGHNWCGGWMWGCVCCGQHHTTGVVDGCGDVCVWEGEESWMGGVSVCCRYGYCGCGSECCVYVYVCMCV
jgi:hypothetical protein